MVTLFIGVNNLKAQIHHFYVEWEITIGYTYSVAKTRRIMSEKPLDCTRG